MKIFIFSNSMRNDTENYDDYVIWIFRNVRRIFNSKNKGVYWEC